MTVNVVATTFQVTALSTNNSGFDVTFDRAANLANLNLYEGGSDSLGLPDVTLTGQHVGPVQGSLVWDATTNTAHFVAYGGQLVPDTYTVVPPAVAPAGPILRARSWTVSAPTSQAAATMSPTSPWRRPASRS